MTIPPILQTRPLSQNKTLKSVTMNPSLTSCRNLLSRNNTPKNNPKFRPPRKLPGNPRKTDRERERKTRMKKMKNSKKWFGYSLSKSIKLISISKKKRKNPNKRNKKQSNNNNNSNNKTKTLINPTTTKMETLNSETKSPKNLKNKLKIINPIC